MVGHFARLALAALGEEGDRRLVVLAARAPLVRKATVVLLYLLPARAPAPALVLLWRLVSRLAEAVGVGV